MKFHFFAASLLFMSGLLASGTEQAWARGTVKKATAKSTKHTQKGKAPVRRLVHGRQKTIAPTLLNPQAEFEDIDAESVALNSALAAGPDNPATRQKLVELALRAARAAEKALSRGDDTLFASFVSQFPRRFAETRPGLEAMSDRGVGAADYALGAIDLHGLGGDRSIDRACSRFASAVGKGFGGARFRHAQCIEERDPAQALALLTEAADAGHVAANERLGRICLEIAPPDVACAQSRLGRASRDGRASATALLAWMLADGLGGTPDPMRAATLYAEAGKKGELSALNNLGELYEKGRGVARNETAAFEHYLAAAGKGFPPSQFNVGRLYAAGRGTERNVGEARRWLRQAEASGINQATTILEALEGDD